MDKRFFMAPEVLVYMSVSGGSTGKSRVLLDDACGITYKEDAGRLPVYGYKDVYFQKAALGKSLTTGVLMVNRSFKNAVGALITYFIGASADIITNEQIKTKAVDDNKNRGGDHKILTELLNNFNINKDLVTRPKQGKNQNPPLPINLTSYVNSKNAISTLVLSNTALLDRYNLNEAAKSALSIITAQITEFESYETFYNDNIPDGSYSGFNGNVFQGQRFLNSKFSNILKQYLGYLNNPDSFEVIGIDSFLLQLSNEVNKLNVSVAKTNNTIVSLEKTPPVTVDSILSQSMFQKINNAGLIVNLEIEYGKEGQEGSFRETLQDCWFTSKTISPSTDNRDVLKDMYQFFARRIV